MKIRSGFVSNSSSSSFCIIGVTSRWASRLAKAEGKNYNQTPEKKTVAGCGCNINVAKFCPECGAPKTVTVEVDADKEPDYLNYGQDSGKIIQFFGGYELEYAGVDAEPLLEDMSIKQANIHFKNLVKKELNVDIPIEAIGFHYGEVSSE